MKDLSSRYAGNKNQTHGGEIELRNIVVDLLNDDIRRPRENQKQRPIVSLDKVLFLEGAIKKDVPR